MCANASGRPVARWRASRGRRSGSGPWRFSRGVQGNAAVEADDHEGEEGLVRLAVVGLLDREAQVEPDRVADAVVVVVDVEAEASRVADAVAVGVEDDFSVGVGAERGEGGAALGVVFLSGAKNSGAGTCSRSGDRPGRRSCRRRRSSRPSPLRRRRSGSGGCRGGGRRGSSPSRRPPGGRGTSCPDRPRRSPHPSPRCRGGPAVRLSLEGSR